VASTTSLVQSATLGNFDAAHETQTGNLAVTLACAQANKQVSKFMHLDLSAAYPSLLNKRLRRSGRWPGSRYRLSACG
jgi:hypothetical protein